jgi:hypothetical protein
LAVPPNTDAAFLREVDEELRRDELAKAARRYGRIAIAAVVVALLAFGGWLTWQWRQQSVAGEQGVALSAAYQELGGAKADDAKAKLASLATANAGGYRALALMSEADLLLAKNDLKGAAAKFAAVAGDGGVGQPFRDLALVRQTMAEFDTLKPDVVLARMRPLAVKGNPWFGSAGEMVAVSYLRMGKRDLAGTIYSQIAGDPDMNDTMRARAVQMAGVLGVDAVSAPKGQKAQ